MYIRSVSKIGGDTYVESGSFDSSNTVNVREGS